MRGEEIGKIHGCAGCEKILNDGCEKISNILRKSIADLSCFTVSYKRNRQEEGCSEFYSLLIPEQRLPVRQWLITNTENGARNVEKSRPGQANNSSSSVLNNSCDLSA
jgi:hypothetical protein